MAAVVRSHTPSTNLLRTLIDLGAVSGDVDAAVSAAITSGAVTPAVLEYLLARHARRGRDGTTALRRALRAWPLCGKPADSELELRMARLLADHHLPPATFHVRLAGFEVDFLVDGTPVVLECDGWDHHGRTREQFERDRERDVILGAAGYVVFHFTWGQVTRRAGWTAQRIRQLVERWSSPATDRSGWAILSGAERIGHPERL
jgi:very-short-patch-repair endonuclease